MSMIEREVKNCELFMILVRSLSKELSMNHALVKKNLIRWIFLLRAEYPNEDIFFPCKPPCSLKNQIFVDLKKKNAIAELICDKITEFHSIMENTDLMSDGQVYVQEKDGRVFLSYSSKSVKKLKLGPLTSDDCLQFEYFSDRTLLHKDLKRTFAQYFRYIYLYCNNQTLAYEYNCDPGSAIECFASPFNHHYDVFFSTFPEDVCLGSSGEFFSTMGKVINGEMTLPSNTLRVNPPFDEAFDDKMVEIVIKLLNMDTKWIISCILPDWTDFKAKNDLLQCKFHVKHDRFKKNSIWFNNFFTGTKITPCDIIIIYLEN